MKISNTAKMTDRYSEQTLTVENLPNGEYLVIAEEETFETSRPNQNRSIKMTFTKNAFNALLGSMMAINERNE